ncbi:Serpentine Receptor, class T [Caenorhabditis elegans]|uniref:Serpentine Receptor, class T n=1 Tax=Caenorhabditis elegans TaxID=6239 RepID=O44492_CAEEL|nr:Serpentine Receptor, class T [Caenorhabditis elegans]CCD69520.1 Serpentine Receptor, class T [Caenorhabditis elegans]|eukprot:NP_500532.2 Serpentine Receptor, class V [Caenorhabditis elegans]
MPLSINLSLLPISHLIFIPICWFSVFLYLRVLYIIHQLRKNVFKSSFFLIIRMHAITDLLMFLYVELVARPRKYRVHNLFEAANDHWIPQLLWFSLTVIKNAMFLGYTVVAVNRCSEIFRFRNHVKFWSPTLILIVYLSEWLAPTIVLIPLFYTGNHNFSLIAAPSGGLFLRASPEFIKLDVLQDLTLSIFCFLVSSFLYLITFVHLVQTLPKTMSNTFFSINRSESSNLNPPTDLIIFKCAFFSFVLFVPNFAKTMVLYFSTNPQLVDIGTELWFFTTEIMCISSPWSLLVSSSKLRKEFIPKRCRKRQENISSMLSTRF